jgi:ribosomal protein S18 acetylase RimI-like enzyme
MAHGPNPVDTLTWSDVPAAVGSLAAAFAEYPLIRVVAPDADRRPRVCEAFCRMLVNYSVGLGAAYATADRAAVACWLPPGREWFSTVRLVRAGGLSLLRRLGWGNLRRFFRITDRIDAERLRLQPTPHWYLDLLGVRPDARGRGLSRVVLGPVFEAADRDRVPCYLETQDEADVAIYRRLGFGLVGEAELAPGLRNWAMRRVPA